jgi:hypothetical protein
MDSGQERVSRLTAAAAHLLLVDVSGGGQAKVGRPAKRS